MVINVWKIPTSRFELRKMFQPIKYQSGHKSTKDNSLDTQYNLKAQLVISMTNRRAISAVTRARWTGNSTVGNRQTPTKIGFNINTELLYVQKIEDNDGWNNTGNAFKSNKVKFYDSSPLICICFLNLISFINFFKSILFWIILLFLIKIFLFSKIITHSVPVLLRFYQILPYKLNAPIFIRSRLCYRCYAWPI